MIPAWDSLVREFFHVLLTVLIVMDPVGMIPQFLSVTSRFDEQTRRSIVKKSVLIAAVVLAVFLLAGKFLLSFFGIMSGTFYISGGILFFLIAFEMIYSKGGPRSTPGEDGEGGVSVALFPLAIPLIAGPGLITVIIMHTSRNHHWLYSLSVLAPALITGLIITWCILRYSGLILRLLGATGILVMEKIMGLILAGYALQLIYNGLVELRIISGVCSVLVPFIQ
jgi:multiple antibiotic resistance protein